MNKTDLIRAASTVEVSSAKAAKVIDQVINAITQALRAGESVVLVGFGTFLTVETAARTGRNPRTGEPIEIPAGRKVKFIPSKSILG